MAEPIEIKKAKIKSLSSGFSEFGYKTETRIGQNEFSNFLNKRTKSGQFDQILLNKLFQFLNIGQNSSISIEEFINGFLDFEEDLRKNAELFNIKLAQEQGIYSAILKQCKVYQSEKLNEEGFCENAKIYGEITDIDIKRELEGIKEIIIIIIYNEKKEEIRFKIGDKRSVEMLKKTFEFKPTSRRDHFEFVMKGVNDRDQVFDIGSRVFPLDDINSQEEYLVQIIIPEMDNPDQIAAYINAIIVLYWSDYKHYERLKRKQEKRLKKYLEAANKAAEYLKMVREIYGDLSQMKPDLVVDFNNEKLLQRKGAKLNVNFNNNLEAETPGANYLVEFNNEKEVQTRGVPLRVEFNNSKEVLSPISHTQNYEYKYDYSSNINQEIINKTEDIINNINSLQNDFNNINSNINTNLPNIDNLSPRIEKINIKKTTEIISNSNYQEMPSNEPQNLNENNLPTSIKEENINQENQENNYSNEQIVKEQINNSQQFSDSEEKSPEASPNLLNNKTNINNSPIDYKTLIQQSTTQTTTETNIKNISQPQYILNNASQNQKIQYGQNENKFDIDAFLHQTTTQTQNQTQSQSQTEPQIFDNGSGGSGFVHEETTETTKTTTTIPMFAKSQIQNQNQNILLSGNGLQNQQNLYIGENSNLGNVDQTTATTTTTTTTTNQNRNISNFNSNEQYQFSQRVGYGTDESEKVNSYGTMGTEIIDNNTNIQNLDPIVNKIQYVNSVNKAIFNENTNNILQSENILPVSYLPEKVNKILIDSNVTTLPLITTPNIVSYDTVQPIIHDVKTYYSGETNIDNNNYNNSTNNFYINNEGNNFNFNSLENGNNNININGMNDNNLYNFNGNNWFGTTQTTQTTTETTNYNQNNYNIPMQEQTSIENQQIQFGI